MGKAQNKGKSLGQIAGEVGFYKLCTAGIGTRILMIGTLTGLQVYLQDRCVMLSVLRRRP
jgi:solute carrier family 25 phosphate transporter 3